jgi:TRAP-type C4-dicarboxylate transport system permease small subunit
MVEKFVRFLDIVYLACIWIAGIAIIVMTIIIPWGVFTRYVFGFGSDWPEPVAILCMVVFTFIGAAASYRAGSHIAVTMLTSRVPLSWRGPLMWIVYVLMALLSLFILIWGAKLCIGTWNQAVGAFPILKVGVTYLPLPIGSGVTLLFVIEQMIAGPQNHRAVVRFDHDESNIAADLTGET